MSTPNQTLAIAADQIEARVQDLSDQLLNATHLVNHHRDSLTAAMGLRDRLKHEIESATNALQHVRNVIGAPAAALLATGATAVVATAAQVIGQ